MHQKQCTAHSGEKRPAASIWKNWVPCVFFCFGTCAIIKHKGKLIPQAKQLPVKIDGFTSVQMCHTHTHTLSLAGWCRGRWGEDEDERGSERWDDHEDEMKNYLTRTRRGERKRRREHQHDTPGPERASPERAREKKSGGSMDTGTRPAEGGKDESAWTNLTQRKPTNTSARDGTDLPGEGRTHEIGDQLGLVGETTQKKQDSVLKCLEFVRCSLSGTVVKSCPNWHKRLSSSSELGAQHVSPHQKPKRPHLQEKDMPVAFCLSCHVASETRKLQ